jgi:hypothetical protein
VSGKISSGCLTSSFYKTFKNISPLQDLFFEFAIFSTTIRAALPLKQTAAQQNIFSQ